MSTTALQAMSSGRICPLVENAAIRKIRTDGRAGIGFSAELFDLLIDPAYKGAFNRTKLGYSANNRIVSAKTGKPVFASYRGFDVYQISDVFYALPKEMNIVDLNSQDWRSDDRVVAGESFSAVARRVG